MAAGIRLISTDFDGTLVGHPSDGRCVPSLARALAEFKASGGLWAINTGRSLPHIIEGIAILDAPVQPDFLVTHEQEIHHRGSAGEWRDFGDWNAVCRARHTELFRRAAPIFQRVRSLVSAAADVTLIEEKDRPTGLITTDELVMDRVVAGIEAMRSTVPGFHYQRNTIYLRFCHADYHKGSALGELCRLTGVSRDETFAIGDHFNDLSMLDGRYARNVACPANAIPEVRAAVTAAGGRIADAPFGEGTARALDAVAQKKPAVAW
ncbi:MAG: HAD hydrolase family protein [Terrimicrobiaceae bacterium]|nr:HAD hydrolase family protein [Terrimicrobiaceae bacterium]